MPASRRPLDNDRFLRALAGQPVDRIPVWIMRQAGRYLPQYRETRAGVEFLDLCRTPDLAATVTLQPIDVFGFDAAILFSDILVPLEPMGLPIRFDEGRGPSLTGPVRSGDDLARLKHPDVASELAFVGRAVEEIKRRLAGRVPLIGFAGAPWTLATYAIEGGTSRSFRWASGWLRSDPASLAKLLDLLASVTIDYLEMQVEAGADALQLFESWGGWLSRRDFEEIALPPIRRITEHFAKRVPVILYVNGSPQHLGAMAASGATALGVDWRLRLGEVREVVGSGPTLQGNLDPAALYAPLPRLEEQVREVLEDGRGGGHVFNLGHGILPDAPVEAVHRLVETVAAWKP